MSRLSPRITSAIRFIIHWRLDLFTDYWEISTEAEIWPLMVGHNTENVDETAQQVSVILNSAPAVPAGNRALEIGAGVGRLLRGIAQFNCMAHADNNTGMYRFTEIIGVDSSMSMVLASQAYLKDWGARVELGDGVSLPFGDESFYFIYSFTSFQHMISLAIIHRNLCEIRRVLTVGGLCRIQTISSNGDDPRDLRTYDGRVFRNINEFAEQFRDVGLEVVGTAEGLTHPKHIWVTARKTG